MGAIVNGLGLQGFRAYGGTFLTFSDYMRGAVRLSALMKLPSIWIWTHDSIGLGEDGPTHQPVEHLCALRAIPRLQRAAPGATPTRPRSCWRFALRQTEAPSAFALSRQNLPVLDPDVGARRRDRARRLRAAGRRRRRARPDPDRHGLRGRRCASRRPSKLERPRRARREHAVHGHLHRAGRGVPRLGAAAVRARARGRRGGQPDGLGPLDRPRRRVPRDDHVRRVGPGAGRVRALRHHRRRRPPSWAVRSS